MSKIILITGGARSGKSTFALKLAKETAQKVAFIATCQPNDDEMLLRIKKHKLSRPKSWLTIEEPYELDKAIKKAAMQSGCVIIDCLTLWVSNLLLRNIAGAIIIAKATKTVEMIRKTGVQAIIVTNEVGMGIVPDNILARQFRDIAGEINQYFARQSDKTYLMTAGIPLIIKNPENTDGL